jgi:hypothetical protein
VNGEVNDGNAARAAGLLNAGLFGTLRAVLAADGPGCLKLPTLAEGTRRRDARPPPGLGEPRGLGWQMATAENAGGDALGKGAFGPPVSRARRSSSTPRRSASVLLTNRLHPSDPDLAQPNQGAQPGE